MGLAPELREAALAAARRSGISLDEWVRAAATMPDFNAAPAPAPEAPSGYSLLDRAGYQLESRPAAPRREADATAQDEWHEPAGPGLAERLGELSQRAGRRDVPAAAAPMPAGVARDPADELAETLAKLEERLERLAADSQMRSGELEKRIAAVDRSLTSFQDEAFEPSMPLRSLGAAVTDHSIPDPMSFSLERALSEITERQHALDPRGREDFAQARMAAPPPAAGGLDYADLHGRLSQLTEQLLALQEPGGFIETLGALRGELNDIARTLQEAAPRRALQALEAEVRELSRRIDNGQHAGGDAQTLNSIQDGLTEVRSALRALAPAESLAGFQEDVRAIDRRIELAAAHGSDGAGLKHIEASIAELRDIASSAASGETVMALASEVQSLGARIDRLVDPAARDSHLLSELDMRFRDLIGQFSAHSPDAAGTDAAAVSGETSAGETSFGRRRTGEPASTEPTLDAISSQLTRLVERLDGFGGSGPARTSGDAGPLHEGLTDSERRTQDTLEAVHDALERVVERLGAMEVDLRGGARPMAAAGGPPAELEALHSPSIAPAQNAGAHTLPAQRRPIDPSLPADHPLEPSTAGRGRAASAAERIAASEAALGNAKPAPETDAKANFIAAARRAAQAAAHTPPLTDEREQAAAGEPNRLVAMARRMAGRKPLLLGLGLLIVAGSLHLAFNVYGVSALLPGSSAKPAATAPSAAAGKTTAASGRSDQMANDPIAASFERMQTAVQPASTAKAETAEAEPAAALTDPRTTSGISPLTIASIQMPGTALGRPGPTNAGRKAPAASETAAVAQELGGGIASGLRNAAQAGDPAAEYEMGTRYAEGRGVAVNFDEAARWLDLAAKHGITPAQYRLGSLYEKGQGVTKDLAHASRLYQAAAIKGHAKAMHNLAVLYADGMDGKPNFKMAAEWFRNAAARGVADSQYNLAILCARGLGVEQDLGESYKWFALAAAQGDHDAGVKRDDIGGRLDPAALAAAKAAVTAFVVEPQPAEATSVTSAAESREAPIASAPASATPAAAAKARLPRRIGPT